MSKTKNGHAKRKMAEFKRKAPHICHYCDKPVFGDDVTVDHRIPSSRGGPDEDWNYAIACKECNNDKGDMTEEEYMAFKKEHRSRSFYIASKKQEAAMERARKDSRYIDVNKFFGRV